MASSAAAPGAAAMPGQTQCRAQKKLRRRQCRSSGWM